MKRGNTDGSKVNPVTGHAHLSFGKVVKKEGRHRMLIALINSAAHLVVVLAKILHLMVSAVKGGGLVF